MKNIFNLFFTLPAKIIMSVIFFVLSLVIANCQVDYFTLYKQDNESFINVMAQVDAFDYESSHYYKNSVRGTVENVTLLCMNYSEIFSGESTVEEILSHYSSIGDRGFLRAYDFLSDIKGLRFAVVNHDRKTIYSNITDINGLDSSENIRNRFAEDGISPLIVHSCKNPYFATDAFIEFSEDIRECADKYNEDFDLYISFGDENSFKEKEAFCRERHFDMRGKIEKLNNKILIHAVFIVLLSVILITVTGKQEKGGKTYPTVMNRLPNDLVALMYGTVLLCLSSLYRTAIGMLLAHGDELDAFWFTRSEEFYTSRVKLCMIIFFCAGLNLICILKRQYKMGTLLSNTYISSQLESFRRLKNTDKTEK